ncbi:MAG: GNAT family N-acetyltransferase [Promethearchaeota archaeon]
MLRKAQLNDARGIHEVLLAAFEEYKHFYSSEGFADTVMSEEVAFKRIKIMNLFVAVDHNNKIIGTIGWLKIGEYEGHVRGMAVHPNFQGKNSPASTLFKIVEEEALSQGCTFLTLDTTEILVRAQNFYRKMGFNETGKMGDFFGTKIFEFAKKISNDS